MKIIGWLPKGLEVLRLGESFQQPTSRGINFLYLEYLSKYAVELFIETKVPVSTTNLIVRADVDIKVGMIPHNVTNIEFGDSFNSSIQPLALPSSIRSISLDDNFHSNLNDNRLLSNVEYIKLGKSFRSPIDIPSTIKTFKLTNNVNCFFLYNADFNECYSLTNLEFGRSDNPNFENNIFPNS
ncbi:hypothetical protein ACTFIR_006616 [Dictyostelium discoideum]